MNPQVLAAIQKAAQNLLINKMIHNDDDLSPFLSNQVIKKYNFQNDDILNIYKS